MAQGLTFHWAIGWWRGLGGRADAPTTAAKLVERRDEFVRPSAVRVRVAGLSEQVECR